MARRRRRRRWRREKHLVVWGAVVIGLVAGWWCVDALTAPDVVVRVLFSESANCTARERRMVAGVMRNRVGNPAFGGAGTLKGVVTQAGAFSCIADSGNGNWRKSRRPGRMTAAERVVWEECVACVSGDIPPAVGPSGRLLVYYHDKSIGMPASWDNAGWRAVREESTEHFVFYSVVPAREMPR